MARYADVIIDISHEKLDRSFQYRIPEHLAGQAVPGAQVEIPFGKGGRRIGGFVIEVTEQAKLDPARIKDLSAVVADGVTVETQLIALAAWMRKNYGATMNQALRTVIPVKNKERPKEKRAVRLCAKKEEAGERLAVFEQKRHAARARLLKELLLYEELPYEVVTQKLNVSGSVIRALEEMRLVEVRKETAYRNPVPLAAKEAAPVALNGMQERAVEEIRSGMKKGARTYLLHGVTGSGKTEVYMELIADALSEGRQAIALIPEIALTYQTVMRFYGRFGEKVSMIHSRLSKGERYDQFLRAKNGDASIMIGPRSALFAPFSNLGLIILDEEHEGSYKSETLPRYHARETAIERARMAGASVVLGSATPSVDSYYKAMRGEYRLVEMKERVAKKPLPSCSIVDLREELRQGNRSILSGKLQRMIEERLFKRQQVMLFLNRRGMSGFVSCRSCGHVMKCPHCDISLSLHQDRRLVCHYCGHAKEQPAACPECGSPYIGGFKAGTQKIEEVVKKRFPQARVLRMDYDTTRSKDGYEKILSAFANREADILIGTQMIVKGHDFPNVTLMGVLAADLSMHAADYRAAERTFQLLTQAAGRAGRGEEPGEVVIQTYSPEHYSVLAAKDQDYERFYRQEIAVRKLLSYPPASHMLLILFTAEREEEAARAAREAALQIRREKPAGLSMIGPANANVAKISDIYRKVIYLKHPDYGQLVTMKDKIERQADTRGRQANITFDFDPMNGA